MKYVRCKRSFGRTKVFGFDKKAYIKDMEQEIKKEDKKCKCCGQEVPEKRWQLGYRTCLKCAAAGVRPIREVSVPATSLQWI